MATKRSLTAWADALGRNTLQMVAEAQTWKMWKKSRPHVPPNPPPGRWNLSSGTSSSAHVQAWQGTCCWPPTTVQGGFAHSLVGYQQRCHEGSQEHGAFWPALEPWCRSACHCGGLSFQADFRLASRSPQKHALLWTRSRCEWRRGDVSAERRQAYPRHTARFPAPQPPCLVLQARTPTACHLVQR